MPSLHRPFLAALAAAFISITAAHGAGFTIERSIALPDTTGRIDHLAIDLDGNLIFVAEHDNGTLDVVNLATGKVSGRITDLAEPQGVAYIAGTGQVVVANGGDGSVKFFDATSLAPGPETELGSDADNIRLAPDTQQVLVGYGDGGLAIIDPAHGRVVKKITLAAHPESFQLSSDGTSAYVNLPDSARIGVADLKTGTVDSISTPDLGGNFPMAAESKTGRLAVAFRSPAKLALVDPEGKAIVTAIDTCGDADDVFFDAKRSLLYITCGAGTVDIVRQAGDRLTSVAKVPTGNGARTGLFVPELDRLFVAAPAHGDQGARILVLKPDA